MTFRFYYETLTSYASVKSNRPHTTGILSMWCGVSLYVPHRGWGAYDALASDGGVRVLASRVINKTQSVSQEPLEKIFLDIKTHYSHLQ